MAYSIVTNDKIFGDTEFLFDDDDHLHIIQIDHKGDNIEIILTDKDVIKKLGAFIKFKHLFDDEPDWYNEFINQVERI